MQCKYLKIHTRYKNDSVIYKYIWIKFNYQKIYIYICNYILTLIL